MTTMVETFDIVKEFDGLLAVDKIIFMHEVVDDGTDKIYGIHVATLAGVPEAVVKRAD